MLKILCKIPSLLLMATLFFSIGANASCKAMFRIERVNGKSFKVLDSSICNKSTTIYKLTIDDGNKKYDYYTYFNSAPYTITWSKDVTLWISLKITDSTGSGCSDSTGQSFVIKSNTCNPDFSVNFSGSPSLNGQFYYLNTNYTVNTRFSLDFGDGNKSTGFNPTHSYANCGSYMLKLIVKDSVVNCKDSLKKELFIGLKSAFIQQLIYERQYWFQSISKYSGNNLNGPDSLYISYHWDFGDGDTSNEQSTYHTFSGPGQYKVLLIANYTHPNNGCIKHDTSEQFIDVGCKGTANFTYSYPSTRTYNFESLAPDNRKHFWDFGDGNSSVATAPTHTYASVQRFYNITLIVDDTLKGCTDTLNDFVFHQCNINASLSLTYDSTQPYKATLTNNSTGFITGHHWDFGDGTTSAAASPVHTYTKTGAIVLIYSAKDTFANCELTDTIRFWIDSAGGLKRQGFVMTIIDKTEASTGTLNIQRVNTTLKVFPNPFSNHLEIVSDAEAIKQMSLYTLTGAQITFTSIGEGKHQIIQLPEGLPSGIYILKVQTVSGVSRCKLMKQ